MAAVSFAVVEHYLLLTSFTVCHVIHNCLSSTKSLILLISPWMYSCCCFGMCKFSLDIYNFFFFFARWHLLGFLSRDIFMLFCFSGTTSTSTRLFAWLVSTLLLLPRDQWRNFLIRHSEFVLDISWRLSNFFLVTVYLLLISLLVCQDYL